MGEFRLKSFRVMTAVRLAARWREEILAMNPARLTKAARLKQAELAKLERPYFISKEEDGSRIIWGYDLRQRWTPCGRGLFEIVEIPIR